MLTTLSLKNEQQPSARGSDGYKMKIKKNSRLSLLRQIVVSKGEETLKNIPTQSWNGYSMLRTKRLENTTLYEDKIQRMVERQSKKEDREC